MEQMDIFDFMTDGDKYKPIESTDWKWTMANDYPKEKNGLKVFSCFACGGGSTIHSLLLAMVEKVQLLGLKMDIITKEEVMVQSVQ